MCGIAGVYSFSPETRVPSFDMSICWAMLSNRGTDACGFALRKWGQEGFASWWKTDVPSFDTSHSLNNLLRKNPHQWLMIHTRNSTKGLAKDNENNHPIVTDDILMVHNGVIWNDEELYQEWGDKVKRVATVDSAAIAHALELGGIEEVVKSVKGSLSIAWVDRRSPNRFNLYTNGSSPLWLGSDNNLAVFASADSYIPERLYGKMTKKGTVPGGTHIVFTPEGIEEYEIGTGVTKVAKPVSSFSSNTAFTKVWKGKDGYYTCYDVLCQVKGDHTHLTPSYTAGEHTHKLTTTPVLITSPGGKVWPNVSSIIPGVTQTVQQEIE